MLRTPHGTPHYRRAGEPLSPARLLHRRFGSILLRSSPRHHWEESHLSIRRIPISKTLPRPDWQALILSLRLYRQLISTSAHAESVECPYSIGLSLISCSWYRCSNITGGTATQRINPCPKRSERPLRPQHTCAPNQRGDFSHNCIHNGSINTTGRRRMRGVGPALARGQTGSQEAMTSNSGRANETAGHRCRRFLHLTR